MRLLYAGGTILRWKRGEGSTVSSAPSGPSSVVKAILRDHKAPICRGDHPSVEERGGFDGVFGTIWSLICHPGRREILLADGHPVSMS